ncbi:siroheme synthase [Tsuneonella deserti]|uniref:precorrin-2 dehydrogenase n=1 Tax=Tsuneonella deserti TaxID=2035528 RepID=A0ABQ1SA40_9SPHN|nr:bifunctional precorrin-2 dehydrogenase/sirohydrochlorin ferrochelatase [Tsuneonella deserti]GGD98022.1 siroheme synthase [Tsuneonella deserti]
MALSSLPLFHRLNGARVVVIGTGAAAEAKRRLLERAGAICCGEPEAHHARMAFVTLEDRREARAAALRLKSKGLLVNVADRPDLCDFTLPSVVERGPVVIAVGTGGASAGLAKQLRLRLETLLPHSLGRLAEGLSAARDRLRARWPDASERRRALDSALTSGGILDPLREDSADALDGWLASSPEPVGTRTVEIVLLSDDPDDLTLRQARWLGEADLILHDAGVPDGILNRARADAERGPITRSVSQPSGLCVVVRAVGSASGD